MKVLFSLSYNPTIHAVSGRHGDSDITTQRRVSDWGKTGFAKYLLYLTEGFHLLRQARRFDVLVLCTVGMEAFVAGKLKRLLCPNTKIICADFLMPRDSKAVSRVRSWLSGIDGFVCIRRGDIAVLGRRFHIPAEKCRFAYFPASQAPEEVEVQAGSYIYSAGIAHRDWPTLVAALAELPYHAVLSAGIPVQLPQHAQEHITILPMQSPEEGRKRMAGASLVVLSLEDTDLPSGPLVLLDAMALGKPVIATQVNGTVDYVNDGEDGCFVPPKNSAALAAAIHCLMENKTLRESIGHAAKKSAAMRFTQAHFLDAINKSCEQVHSSDAS